MTFKVLRAAATFALTFACLYGVGVAALAESPSVVWLAVGLSIACLFVVCAVWELD